VTVIIGPNGSGKTTAMEAIKLLAARRVDSPALWLPIYLQGTDAFVTLRIESKDPDGTAHYELRHQSQLPNGGKIIETNNIQILKSISTARVFSFDSGAISQPCEVTRTLDLESSGRNLAAVMATLQVRSPERFEMLNQELRRWMPEFDRVVFEIVSGGLQTFQLCTVPNNHRVPASHLSQGNLVALALLTLSYLPNPPVICALEEIDRGIHPRLLREAQDAINRLAYPENFEPSRKPVQVIVTTHSPYFLDLFRDHPEDIVIAEKNGTSATFSRLIDLPHMHEILGDAALGEAWYSGVLGGVPAGT